MEINFNTKAAVLATSHNIASVKVTLAKFIDYCRIEQVNGKAKIINVLKLPNH